MKTEITILIIILCILAFNTTYLVNYEVKPMISQQEVFRTYIPLLMDAPKIAESYLRGIDVQGYVVVSTITLPRYTDVIVYDNNGHVDHTVQCVIGYDIVVVTHKKGK